MLWRVCRLWWHHSFQARFWLQLGYVLEKSSMVRQWWIHAIWGKLSCWDMGVKKLLIVMMLNVHAIWGKLGCHLVPDEILDIVIVLCQISWLVCCCVKVSLRSLNYLFIVGSDWIVFHDSSFNDVEQRTLNYI